MIVRFPPPPVLEKWRSCGKNSGFLREIRRTQSDHSSPLGTVQNRFRFVLFLYSCDLSGLSIGQTRPPSQSPRRDNPQQESPRSFADGNGDLSAPDEGKVYKLEAGKTNTLPSANGSYVLEGQPGSETFLILISEAALGASDFHSIVETTGRALKPDGKNRDLLVAEALAALRRDSRIAVESYSYQLMAPAP